MPNDPRTIVLDEDMARLIAALSGPLVVSLMAVLIDRGTIDDEDVRAVADRLRQTPGTVAERLISDELAAYVERSLLKDQ